MWRTPPPRTGYPSQCEELHMARKPNYSFEKHRKEIAKQKKKAEKRQRKQDKKAKALPTEESE